MIKVPFQALKPFLNDEITFESISPGRDILTKPFIVPALVMECDPFATSDGIGPDAQKPKWTAMVNLDALEGRTIPVGAIVAKNSKHPRCFVTSVHPNSDSLWLDLTSTEAV